MNKTFIVFIVIGIISMIIGIVLIIAGGTFGNWNVNYTEEVFNSEQPVQRLDISVAAGSAKVEFYDGENVEIDYLAHPKYGFTVSENNGTVKLEHVRRNWFSWGFGSRKTPTATVKIPTGLVVDLTVSVGAGSASVQSGTFKNVVIDVSAGKLTMGDVVCDSVDCDVSAGSAKLDSVTCTAINCDVSAGSAEFCKVSCDAVDLDVSAGTVNFTMLGNKSDYTITVDKSAGSCNVTAQTGNVVGKRIDVDVSAGTVNVNFN